MLALLLATPGHGTTVTFTESGVSAAGTPLTVSATLIATGTTLTIRLSNVGDPTRYKADVLTSLYFNLADPADGQRPTLTYVSGSGQAYEVVKNGADTPVSWNPTLQQWTTTGTGATAASMLVATKPGDEGWQFKTLTPAPDYPQLGFGIGTVGNSGLSDVGANFDGRVVSGVPVGQTMINLGIYSNGNVPGVGDIDPQGGLDHSRLINTFADFTFTSDKELETLNETWVQGNVTFGFGTGPDSVLLPEPGTWAMATTGSAVGLMWLARRRWRRAGPRRPAGP